MTPSMKMPNVSESAISIDDEMPKTLVEQVEQVV
ncbi:hypothetical protein PR003_g13045 [Phytophthora rubi]|uniref:Uncharacterized protein n=1 Tax=Phytophthora rubi TaxID=129364 RepID=A0A6A3LIY1_9STRA|nr:hypothetical protein PR002_g13089 [Phytophthora rubi]KAE9335370.1 hypothetical protein PR003_g13045 [Phytophthora rubi]